MRLLGCCSALSLGNLRQEAVTWDFEEGERSDDEGGEAPQDAKENAAETLEADPVESETDDDPEDPLTSFGQVSQLLLSLLSLYWLEMFCLLRLLLKPLLLLLG